MPILTESDKPIYFPDITLTGDALMGAILRAQMLAESNMGCDRPLEKSSFKEVLSVHSNSIAWLTRAPIDETSDFHVDARTGGYKDGFGRIIPKSAWFPLVKSDYAIDESTGEVNLSLQQITEIRATYTAGFDFTLDTPDVRRIKSAVAAILNYQQSNAYQGLQEVSVEGEYKVRYGSGGGVGTIPDVLLIPFRKYRPRSFC